MGYENFPPLVGGGALPYLELAYVCAPNTAGQALTAGTLATLTLDTIVQNTFANFNSGNLSGNQFTIPTGDIGEFYGELTAPILDITTGNACNYNLFLTNITDSNKKEIRGGRGMDSNGGCKDPVKGQFKITASKAFELQVLVTSIGTNIQCRSGVYNSAHSNSTAGLDQRGTVKLWKLS